MMPSAGYQREAAVLESLIPNLEAEGYEVFVHPNRTILPPFMGGYRPDLIALKRDKKLAVEIVGRQMPADARLERIQEIFFSHPEWEFRVVYAPGGADTETISPQSRLAILRVLDCLQKLLDDAGPVPTLLTAWALFEAASRLVAPDQLQRPQPSVRLVEAMASEGHITPGEADILRRLAIQRNRAAHGEFEVAFTRAELEQVSAIVRTLIAMAPGDHQASPPA